MSSRLFACLPAVALAFAMLIERPASAQTVPNIPNTRPRVLLVGAELTRLQADLAANKPAIVRWKSFIDNKVGGQNYGDIADSEVAMMGIITGLGSYCTYAVAHVDTFLDEEAAFIQTGTPPYARRDHYLEIGYTVGEVALVYDYCHAHLTAAQRQRWGNYADQALFNVWNQNLNGNGLDNWGVPSAANGYSWARDPMSGLPEVPKGIAWSVDNPANNYYYSFLRATMLWGIVSKHEPGRTQADVWLNKFRIEKLQNQLRPLFDAQLQGGGSREGTGYGTAMRSLFDLYYIWEKSTGERLADLNVHTSQSLPYMMHAIAPDKKFLANIGDQARDKTGEFFAYHREKLLILSTLFSGTPMARSAKDFLATSPLPITDQRLGMMRDALHDRVEPQAPAQLNTSYFASGVGHFFDRSSWQPNATWLTMLVGPYTESHAHMDALSFQWYKNGRWLVQDANVQGRNGLQNDQRSHALVRQTLPDGTEVRTYARTAEEAGGESRPNLLAMAVKPHYTYVAGDQGTLFNHPSTGNPGASVYRAVLFIKPDTLIVFDRAAYSAGTTTKTFQLPMPGQAYEVYYDNTIGNRVRTTTPVPPMLSDPVMSGRTMTHNNGANTLVVRAISPVDSQLSVTDMYAAYGIDEYLFGKRFDASVTNSGSVNFLHVLSVDGAVSQAVRGANDGTVTVNLADGRTVDVAFNLAGQGGTLQIRDVGGAFLVNESLPTSVTSPPVLNEPPVVLTVSRTGTGQGSVSSQPAGIQCGVDCSESLPAGTAVTLAAVPEPGSAFAGWSGVTCAGGNTSVQCQFTLSSNIGVTASFDTSRQVPQDLNDDARSDLFWRNTGDGSVQGWLMNGLSATQVAGLLPAGGYSITHVADLDGNGKADTLLRHTDGTVIAWLHDGLSVTAQVTLLAAGSGWSVKHAAELNGDGRADLILEHADGTVVGWLMNGVNVSSAATFVPAGAGWTVTKVGDLDGDGRADLIWQHTSGTVQAWLMNGLTATQVATFAGPGTGWAVKLVADFNGDGKTDLVWQNVDGSAQGWLMNGLSVLQTASFVPSATGWAPVLAGDIDGDGKADLFWEHSDGRSQTWLMNGLSVNGIAGFVGSGGWRATHLLDLNGDGRRDVLWKHSDGSVQAWLMNGLTISQIARLAAAGSYEVVPARP